MEIKMKKISLVLLICMLMQTIVLPNVSAAADDNYDYFVEGESFTASNWSCSGGNIGEDSACSGGKFIRVYADELPPRGYFYADYEVNAENAGVYELFAAMTSVMNDTWASNVTVRVNSGKEFRLTGEIVKSNGGNSQYLQSLDAVNLNKGINTMRFIVRNPRSDGKYTVFMDYFALKKTDWKIRNITSEAPFFVFEDNSDVKLTINANAQSDTSKNVSWVITDSHGNAVNTGTSIIPAGDKSVDVTVENLPLGYYQIAADGVVCGFSVVKALSERTKYDDTPFAVDTNFSSAVQDYLKEDYANVLALSGVSWIRERVWFKNITSYNNGEYQFANGGMKRVANLLKPYGIKISAAADYMPDELIGEYSKYIPDDLNKSYSFWKQAAKSFDGAVDNWEIFNEVDHGGAVSSSDSPDLYSSFMKASAVGIADAQTANKTTASVQGAAARMNEESEYLNVLMMNDALDYSVCDNTHEHTSAENNEEKYYPFSGIDNIKAHISAQKNYSASAPVWVTEAGISIQNTQNRNFTLSEQMTQAKYLVTSAVESVASGTGKHFFFIGPNYDEDERAWGMTSRGTLYPYMYASLAAQSAMTDLLGKGEFLENIGNLSDDVCGYSFYNGTDTVYVLWSKNGAKNISLGNTAVPSGVYDLFGNKKANECVQNMALDVSEEPIYVKFSGKIRQGINSSERASEEKSFTKAQRIILTQKYSDEVRGGARTDGYSISSGDTVNVSVSNLNDSAVSGTIYGRFANGGTLDRDQADITIDAMSTATVTFTVESMAENKDYLIFYGEFDGEKTSDSAAMLKMGNDGSITAEAKNSEYSDGFTDYGNGIYIITTNVKDYSAEMKVNVPEDGMYKPWVLAQLLNYEWSSDFDIYVNDKKIKPLNVNNKEISYWHEHAALGWNSFESIMLKKGENTVRFVTNKNRNAGDEYLVAALDKIVFVKDGSGLGWREAENYSQKIGLYYYQSNANAGNGAVMKLFTYGIENPITDNRLGYDFYVDGSGKYDIWVLSSQANVSWLTKWKWSLNSGGYVYPNVVKTVQADYSEQNISMYWQCLGQGTTLKNGYNNISFLSDAKRSAGDYMLHAADAVVVAKTGEWSPSGNVSSDKISAVAANMFSGRDMSNITENLVLPTNIEDITVEWSSSAPQTISADGTVTRPEYGKGNAAVTLTAVFTRGDYSSTYSYNAVVLQSGKPMEINTGVYDENGGAINVLQSKNIVKTEFINDSDSDVQVDAYYAVHDTVTGELISISGGQKNIPANSTVSVDANIELTGEDLSRYKLNGFVWRNMRPMADVFEMYGKQDKLNTPVRVDKKLYISGNTGKSGETVAVSVFSKSIDEILTNPTELLKNAVYFGEVTTKQDGSYSIEVILNKESDVYSVRIGGNSAGVSDREVK